MTRIVDASVAILWYIDSPGSERAREIVASGEELLVPDLVVAEVANAAWKLARAGQIGSAQASSLVAAVPSVFSHLVPAAELAPRAFALARRFDHPVYDCLYLALAEIAGAPLATADRRLARKVLDAGWTGQIELLGA